MKNPVFKPFYMLSTGFYFTLFLILSVVCPLLP